MWDINILKYSYNSPTKEIGLIINKMKKNDLIVNIKI